MEPDNERPWYADGLAFECLQCGRCCAGPEQGYIWIDPAEIEAAAKFLGITPQQFADRFVRREGNAMTILENQHNDCVFLLREGDVARQATPAARSCAIYPVRPMQCRTWPFWKFNLSSPKAWCLAADRCPGINKGRLHSLGDIAAKRDISPT
jgi:Fe-S-cluster containining protein